MAPRMPESFEGFIARLRAGAASEAEDVRFGAPHFTHAVTLEAGVWRVRSLVVDEARVKAYQAKHTYFMPEHAEAFSVPGPDITLEADSLDGLIAALSARPWPLR